MAKKSIDYEDAVHWIADNDAPAGDDGLEILVEHLTAVLVADLFSTESSKVAADVLRERELRALRKGE